MFGKEDLKSGVVMGIILSLIIGGLVAWSLKPGISSIIFILSLALLPGFFISSLLHLYKIGKEKMEKQSKAERFDWGVEVNLRRVQILYSKYLSMLKTAGFLAGVSFFAMVFIAVSFPDWGIGHQIFFPISTIMFIMFLHFSFRWWFALRENLGYLKFTKVK